MSMRHIWLGGLALGLLAAVTPARAQVKPAVEEKAKGPEMTVIYNGQVRTVHYYNTKGLTAKEVADLRQLEQADNDIAWAKYDRDNSRGPAPSLRDAWASEVAATYPFMGALPAYGGLPAYGAGLGGYGAAPAYFFPRWAPSDFYGGYLSALAYDLSGSASYYPALSPYGYLPYTGWSPYVGFAPYALPAVGGVSTQVVNVGTGNGGGKAEAEHPTAEQRLTEAEKRRDTILANISPQLAKRLGPDVTFVGENKEKPAARPMTTVTMKNGTKHEGRLVKRDKGWITLETDKGETQIRESEAASITTAREKKE